MGKQKKKIRFKARVAHHLSKPWIVDIKPDDLATYVRQAEPQVIPIIKELDIDAGAAVFLLAQYAQVLISGNDQITLESATTITDSVLAIWQGGAYQPSTQYPFTLEDTLEDLKGGLKAKVDYSKHIQPFMPSQKNMPVGIGRLAAGIALHPKTLLWQVWIIADGPCALLGAYRDPLEAQRCLESIINLARHGDTTIGKHSNAATYARHVYNELMSRGDGKSMDFSYDMMAYLLENIDLYTVEL